MKTIVPRVVVFWGMVLTAASVSAAEPGKPWPFSPERLRPFWTSPTMDGETALFIKETTDAPARASLLFEPTEILSVRDASGAITYEEGRDYVWRRGARELVAPPGSRIVAKTPEELRRPAGSQPYRLTHRDGGGEIFFGAKHEYHDMQTVVSYRHAADAWRGPQPSFAGDALRRTVARLAAKEPVRIVLLGDSISTGCNASAWAGAAPFQPPYQDLLVMNLKAVYGADVSLRNLAVGGTNTAWGRSQIGKVIEAKPDLVILAFGMNDAAGCSAKDYQANILAMIDAVRGAAPEVEFILIATMLGNRDWTTLKHERFAEFRDVLAELCGPGVALADMTSIWAEMLRHKKDADLTGNGVNHPNDFGHRVYAQVLSAILIPQQE